MYVYVSMMCMYVFFLSCLWVLVVLETNFSILLICILEKEEIITKEGALFHFRLLRGTSSMYVCCTASIKSRREIGLLFNLLV